MRGHASFGRTGRHAALPTTALPAALPAALSTATLCVGDRTEAELQFNAAA